MRIARTQRTLSHSGTQWLHWTQIFLSLVAEPTRKITAIKSRAGHVDEIPLRCTVFILTRRGQHVTRKPEPYGHLRSTGHHVSRHGALGWNRAAWKDMRKLCIPQDQDNRFCHWTLRQISSDDEKGGSGYSGP